MRNLLIMLGLLTGISMAIPNPQSVSPFTNATAVNLPLGVTNDNTAPGDIIICTKPNYRGNCLIANYMKRCGAFPVEYFHDVASIVQLVGKGGTVSCFYYTSPRCKGNPRFNVQSGREEQGADDLGDLTGLVAAAGCQDYDGPPGKEIKSQWGISEGDEGHELGVDGDDRALD